MIVLPGSLPLAFDSFAQPIAGGCNLANSGSRLLSQRFDLPCAVQGASLASITFCWKADDQIGDPLGNPSVNGPNNSGVFINGTPINSSFVPVGPMNGGSLTTETCRTGFFSPSILRAGINHLQVYHRDVFNPASGIVYAASFTITLTDNDLCANCRPLTLPAPGQTSVQQYLATGTSFNGVDGSSSCDAPSTGQDMWFCVTAPCYDVRLTLDTCPRGNTPPYDTILSVHTACPGTAANQIVCNDNYGNAFCPMASKVTFRAKANTSYYVRVAGPSISPLPCVTVPIGVTAELNDDCADAFPIGAGDTVLGTTSGTSADPAVACPPGNTSPLPDVWYDFVPACAGPYTVSICAAGACPSVPGWDATLSVHQGCTSPPLGSSCNPRTPPPFPPSPPNPWGGDCGYTDNGRFFVTFQAQECTHYYIRVGSWTQAHTGTFQLTITPDPPSPPPPNDNWCGNPPPIISGTAATFNTCGATTDGPSSEPIFNDVWFSYFPECSGTVTIDTCGSPANFDTAIAAYMGICLGPLVGFNDNAATGTGCAGSLQSSMTFSVQAHVPYSIRVGSAIQGRHVCGRLNITGPNPIACPPACQSSPSCDSAHPWQTRLFQILGPASNTDWSWCLSQPCCFSFQGDSTSVSALQCPVCPSPITPACVAASSCCLAFKFCTSINHVCPLGYWSVRAGRSFSCANDPGQFFVKTRACFGTNPPYPSFVLSVGPLGTPCAQQCIVADFAGPDPIPTSGPCSFNPPIVELPLSGLDCNHNGDDDTIDILQGWSNDTNSNSIPDECENPCAAVLNDTFEGHLIDEPVCGLNGWQEWNGSEDVCGRVTTEQAFSGTQSLKIVGNVGGSAGLGDDTVRRVFGADSGSWTFKTMTFVPITATGTGGLVLLSTYDDPPGSPATSYKRAVQVKFNADSNLVIADFGAGAVPIVKGRWVEFRVEIDLEQDTADYYYDGAPFVLGRSWTCGLGPTRCGTERRLQALDLYAGEPAQGGTSGMYFDDILLERQCPPLCIADFNNSGEATVQDIFDFLAAYFQAGPTADVNNSGDLTIQDIFDFLAAYFQGC